MCAALLFDRDGRRLRCGPLNFREPQQDLIDNVSKVLREQYDLDSREQQQHEALQRFLSVGVPFQSAIFMAASQYPCASTDR